MITEDLVRHSGDSTLLRGDFIIRRTAEVADYGKVMMHFPTIGFELSVET